MLIYAHRGASAHARGNTLEAYTLAIEHGADGIELDVRRSKDDVLVLSHEDRAEPELPPFVELTFDEIRASTPWVPTLDEAWAVIGPEMLLNVEMKNRPDEVDHDPTHRLAAWVAEWLERTEETDHILLSSFNHLTLAAAKDLVPDTRTGLLAMRGIDPLAAITEAKSGGHATVNVWIEPTLERAEEVVDAAGDLDVLVYTVNDPRDAARLQAAGIAGIFADDPKMMREALSA
ncbi:MAG: glycerophosphodiester phosphodiesterase [Actinomycetota bacterium]